MYYILYLFTQIYAWPLLETLFSEVLTRDEWLMLFDNVFTNHPSFLLMVVVAYAMSARGPLMQCVELDDFRVSEVQDWDTKNKNKKHFYKNSTDLQIFKFPNVAFCIEIVFSYVIFITIISCVNQSIISPHIFHTLVLLPPSQCSRCETCNKGSLQTHGGHTR